MDRFARSDAQFTADAVNEPRPTVQLVGVNGNAYVIVGKVAKAMRRAGCSKEHIAAYKAEATSGDYDHLLATTMRYVDVE